MTRRHMLTAALALLGPKGQPKPLHAYENRIVVELSGVGRYDREIARMIRAEVERVKANR